MIPPQAYTDYPLVRPDQIFYKKMMLNGSPSLSVDGSVTPKVFSLESLLSTDDFLLTKIDLIISENEAIDITDFGARSALTNGVIVKVDGEVLFQNNGDIMLFLTRTNVIVTKVEGLPLSVINGSWNPFEAYHNSVITNKNDFTITIQDDLSAVSYFEIAVSGIVVG